jgi:hypothetical protein
VQGLAPPDHATAPVLEIDPDTELSLQVPGGVRTSVRLLGRVPGKYLVLRGSGLQGLRFSYGDSVILRYLHAGVVCAFRTFSLKMTNVPEPLLFVSYPRPQMVRQHSLRSAQRITCTLPARLMLKGLASTGVVVDLSATGCQYVLPLAASGANELAEAAGSGQDVELRLLSFLDEPPELALAGKIRRSIGVDRRLRLGIEFEQPQAAAYAYMAGLLGLSDGRVGLSGDGSSLGGDEDASCGEAS